ncbi:MAG: EamA family transporter [Lewinella sp.]|nr:EamA family transporter [Lewinella sp.]
MDARTRGIWATVLAGLAWSTAGLFLKLLPQGAFTILCYRALYVMGVFFLLYRREVFRFNRQTAINAFFYAGLAITFVLSTKMTTAANAIFLQYTGTAYILILEPLLFKLPLRRINIITTVACFLGMGLFFLEDFDWQGLQGIFWGAISGLMFAGLFLGQRSNPPEYHVGAIFFGNVLVVLVSLPFWLQSAPPTLAEHGMLAFLGIFQLSAGYALFTYGLKRITAMEASLIAMLEPLFNPIWVMLGHGETPSLLAWIGGGIIITALIIRLLVLRRQKLIALRQLR